MIFYGKPLPEFEDDNYVELELNPEIEMSLEKSTGCRIIEVGNPPFTSQALAIVESIDSCEGCKSFHPLPVNTMADALNDPSSQWKQQFKKACDILKINLAPPTWYLV